MRAQGLHAKALRIRALWSEIGRTPGCRACETPGPGKSHADRIKMPGTRAAEQHQRRRRNVELLQIQTHDHWTRAEVRRFPNRRGQKRPLRQTTNPTDQMDEDNFRRGPATSHQQEPVDDENVSKKARVARNVLHIRGEDHVKFDVNEEAWPNAELAVHSSYGDALIDGLPADKVKAGDEQQMKDLQLYSWVKETDIPPDKSILLTGWARRMKVSEVRSRCVLKDFATTVRDDVFAPTPTPLPVRGQLLYAAWFDLRVETGDLVCAFMQADSSCEMFAGPPKGQERDGWIWRLHGAMNGIRTASRDFSEFLAGVNTEHMGYKRRKLERCLFFA